MTYPELRPAFEAEDFIEVFFHSIIVKRDPLKAKFPGGLRAFIERYGSHCTRELAAICSMSLEDMDNIALELIELGLTWDEDMAAVDAGRFSLWQAAREHLGMDEDASNEVPLGYAWLKGELCDTCVRVRFRPKSDVKPVSPDAAGTASSVASDNRKRGPDRARATKNRKIFFELNEKEMSIMYSPDTLERLNDRQIEDYEDALLNFSWRTDEDGTYIEEFIDCENCGDEYAGHVLPVYNPADGVRGVEGAYSVLYLCDRCYESGDYLEKKFYCDDCGELFIFNHSWDVLAGVDRSHDKIYCQKCYAENHLKPVSLGEVLESLKRKETGLWKRLNTVPGKELLVELDFAPYPDFPGHTTLNAVRTTIRKAAKKAGLENEDLVYPVVTQTYQFSVVMAVFTDKAATA